MENPYGCLVQNPITTVTENAHTYHYITERHIQALWLEQKYVKNLTSCTGEPIEVISPGIWNIEAGPDFRKAHIKIGQKEFVGDVEIHLHDESWVQHQHHLDERYNHVILHVSVWLPRHPVDIVNLEMKSIRRMYLEPFLTIPLARIAQYIDLDLYPYKKFLGSGRCAQELFKGLAENEIRHFFQKASDWRLQQKNQFFKMRVGDPALYAGAGIAMALGYKNNAEAFLDLFIEMQSQSLPRAEIALAWLLAKCGFFNEYFSKKWGESPHYRQLEEHAKHFAVGERIKLALNQIRPLNHPVRRLAYLALMHFDDQIPLLIEKMKQLWDLSWPDSYRQKKWKPFLDACLGLIPSYHDDYWSTHYLFETVKKNESLGLIGADLKREIVINTLLPLLKGELHAENQLEIEAFWHFYRSLPASKTGKAKYLMHRFFGNTPKGALLNKADSQQGAYQLHHDFCVHFEASCEGCPFVERFKRNFS